MVSISNGTINARLVDRVAPVELTNVDDPEAPMTIPFGEPEPSDALLRKSVSTTRLRVWLNKRLRSLAVAQRIQDARALRSEFSLD